MVVGFSTSEEPTIAKAINKSDSHISDRAWAAKHLGKGRCTHVDGASVDNEYISSVLVYKVRLTRYLGYSDRVWVRRGG